MMSPQARWEYMKTVYDEGRIPLILKAAWKASGYLCGSRLAAAVVYGVNRRGSTAFDFP